MEIQKAAVGALLERSDARSWGLVQQIRLVETQLAALTTIEIDKRKLKLTDHLVSLFVLQCVNHSHMSGCRTISPRNVQTCLYY